MATFPVPHLERRTFQDLPDEGTLLTETALLHLLRDLLQPLADIAYVFATALSEIGGGRVTETLVSFIEEILEQAVLLLEAWHDHQADSDDEEEEDDPDDLEASTPPPRRRPRRSQTPRTGEGA